MEREAMLDKLKNISPGTELTWLPNEYALECEYVTKEGTAYEWIGMNDWPVAAISSIPRNKFENIKDKIRQKILTEEDIYDTGLGALWSSYINDYHEVENMDIQTFFSKLVEIDLPDDGIIYALIHYRISNEPTLFFTKYQNLADAFENSIRVDSTWDSMDDIELAEWVQRLENDFGGITMMTYSLEEGE